MFYTEIIESITNRPFYIGCIVYCYWAFVCFYLKSVERRRSSCCRWGVPTYIVVSGYLIYGRSWLMNLKWIGNSNGYSKFIWGNLCWYQNVKPWRKMWFFTFPVSSKCYNGLRTHCIMSLSAAFLHDSRKRTASSFLGSKKSAECAILDV